MKNYIKEQGVNKMTFDEFINKVEREREHCQDEFDTCKTVKDYLQMGHYIAIIRAYDWVLELAKDVEIGETKHNEFSWENVNIGDEVVETGYKCCVGKVIRLIFDGDGCCCGMIVEFPNYPPISYQDNEYKQLLRIGSWYNEL